MLQRYRWIGAFLAALIVGSAGLVLGKFREGDYLRTLYKRTDFTLLDDEGEFFSLHSLPQRKLALLIFTPDGIPPSMVEPVFQFGLKLDGLTAVGIEPFLVSRVNREIVRNFKRAARFPARLLLDTGGTVSRNSGVWEGPPVKYWAYVLTDREFNILWRKTSEAPMPFEQLMAELKAAK